MIFDESGLISGHGGCNDYSGGYLTNGVDLLFEELRPTLIVCDEPEGVMTQEDKLFELLERVEAYRIILDEQDHEILEMTISVMEDDNEIEKVLLVFYDLHDGSPDQ